MIRRYVVAHLLLLFVASGCHQYHPAEPEAVSRGSDVRVRLTEEGRESLAGRTVRFERELEGSLLRVGPDSVWIVSPRGNRSSVSSPSGLIRDTLALARNHVEAVEEREIDVLRTAGIIGGGVVGVGIFAATTVTEPSGIGPSGNPNDSGEAGISIPLSIP